MGISFLLCFAFLFIHTHTHTWYSLVHFIPCCIISLRTVVWCSIVSEQQKIQILGGRAKNQKQWNSSNPEILDSHMVESPTAHVELLPCVNRASWDWRTCAKSDWMCVQTDLFHLQGIWGLLAGKDSAHSISWALHFLVSLAVRLKQQSCYSMTLREGCLYHLWSC